jgi:hypothetical protein
MRAHVRHRDVWATGPRAGHHPAVSLRFVATTNYRLTRSHATGAIVQYTHFEIENFKGIKLLRLDLDPAGPGRIHTLVGLNESGKTTILEAIDLFTGGAEELDPKELAGRIRPNENDLVPIAQRANFNGCIRISAGIQLENADVLALQNHMKKKYRIQLKSIPREFDVTDQYKFVNSLFAEKTTLWPSKIGLARGQREKKDWDFAKSRYEDEWLAAVAFLRTRMPAIWYFPNFLFDFSDRIFLRPQPAETATDRFYRALLQDVLDTLELDANVNDHLLARALSSKAADEQALKNMTLQMSRRLSSDVFAAWRRILRRDIDMRVALSVESTVRTGEDDEDIVEPYVEFQIEDSDGFFYVHERSLGFRWFFVFLLLTTFRGLRRNSSREILFLFDEPASNLHPSAQAQLLESLERLASRSRVIYTTHSHHLVNPDWLEQTFVVRNKGADPSADLLDLTARQTDIGIEKYRVFAAAHPEQSQYFQPVLDVLDYAPSRLELVDDLVLVEGKNDFYALRFGELLHDLADLHLYPGGGAGSLDHVIALYLAWGREIVVLLDSDTEGETQRARYLDRFGALLEGRIFLLGELAPSLSGKALDAAFSDEDRLAVTTAMNSDVERPTKKQFFRSLQEAVASKRVIRLTSEAETTLKSILDGLHDALGGTAQAGSEE